MTLDPGTILNQRYRILSILGQGGMGAVYHAMDLNLGVDVALKENLYLSEEFARQFKREAAILATIKHPNLPRVSDHFEIKGQGQYLVMDYMDGEDLRLRMDREGIISDSVAVSIGAAICNALEYLHNRQPAIIHRDIKPGNIRIAADGHISLVDFGLAKLDMGDQETTTGARAMTPGYSPPEQYGQARTDPRSDVYSLGATLYAAVTGWAPEDSLSRATGYTRLTQIRKHNPKVSKKLAAVIERAMEIKPDNRYLSAMEMKKALLDSVGEKATDSKVFLAPPPSIEISLIRETQNMSSIKSRPVTSPAKPYFKTRFMHFVKLAGITIAVVIFVAAGTSIIILNETGLFRKTSTTETKPAATSVFEVKPADLPITINEDQGQLIPTAIISNEEIAKTILETLLSPTAHQTIEQHSSQIIEVEPEITSSGFDNSYQLQNDEIAFVSMRTSIPQIWIMDSNGGSLRQLTNLKNGACQPSWSPDGSKLVFISPCYKREYAYPKSNLYTIGYDGSNLTALDPGYGGNYDPAWSPDNTQIAFTKSISGTTQIYLYNFEDKLVTAASNHQYPSKHPAWSADGKYLAYINTRYSGEIWVRDNSTGNSLQLTHSRKYNNNWPAWSPSGNAIIFTQSTLDPFFPWLTIISYPATESALEAKIPVENNPVPSPASDADISSDGNWLVLEAWPEGNNHDIYIMKISGESVTRLTDDERLDFHPVWRPRFP